MATIQTTTSISFDTLLLWAPKLEKDLSAIGFFLIFPQG
jgi:hypothetical protein